MKSNPNFVTRAFKVPLQPATEQVTTYQLHAGASLLKAAAAVMTSNAEITTELAALHQAIGGWAAVPGSNTDTATVTPPAEEPTTPVGRSGAGSIAVCEKILKKRGHGRLGRTHMDDVDRLPETARNELDIYLRRTITATVPPGGRYTAINTDAVFATLSAFGLGLEDRTSLADVVVFHDADHQTKPEIARLQNFAAHYYSASTNKFEKYWKASALETIIELAQYRGLFDDNGFLKAAEDS